MEIRKRRKRISHPHEPLACLNCGKLLDRAMGVGTGTKPEPGSVTMCLGCGHVQAYNEEMKFRELTDEEIVEVAGDKRLLAAQWARGEYLKEKKSHPPGMSSPGSGSDSTG